MRPRSSDTGQLAALDDDPRDLAVRRIVAPSRRAASAKEYAVAFGSAKPESGSWAAAPTSSTRQPGTGAHLGRTCRVLIPIACCRATLRASAASPGRRAER
jgi:hypothetical protein